MEGKKKGRVLILYTGGTFGMIEARGSSRLQAPGLGSAELKGRLLDRVPELEALAHCRVDVLFNKDSAHVGPVEWLRMADAVRKGWRRGEGVVLLHGTDSLAYSAAALSFLLPSRARPLVLTGAQRPLAAIRTDARRNLISAVEIAAHGPLKVVGGVTVFFDNRLFRGNRVRKRSAVQFSAFESPQAAPLAEVGTEIQYAPAASTRTRGLLSPRFSERVVVLQIAPGFPARAVAHGLLDGVDGLVLGIFPSGTGPTHDPQFLAFLKEARKRGVPVVATAEGAGGEAHPRVYEAGRALLDHGVFWAGAMTPECAYVKTSLCLAQPSVLRARGAAARVAAFGRVFGRQYAGEG